MDILKNLDLLNVMPTKLYFPRRIPEPKAMGELKMKTFEHLAKENYKQWMIPLVDHALEVSQLKSGRILAERRRLISMDDFHGLV